MKLRIFIATCFILAAATGWTDIDIDSQDIGSEKITDTAKKSPFSFNTYIDAIDTAKINKGFYKGDKIHFAEAEAEAGMVVYYAPAYTEGARVAVGYTATYLRWAENPWFDQDHFNNLNVSLTGFSKRLDQWFWRTQLTANIDTSQWSAMYTSYDILLWGRYSYCDNNDKIGVHFGFLAQTGLRLDRLYPIIGFDWQISRKLKLNLVYPVNISLVYSITPRWSIAAAGRFFNSRFRVHHKEIFSKALVRYTNAGGELAIKYETEYVSANIHGGFTFGGKYRVSNSKNHHPHNYRFDGSAYVGGEVDVTF